MAKVKWSPTSDQRRFIKEYAKALESGDAALFAGAGLSRDAGYVDWKLLLREIAQDLGLDISKETDLIAIAQYHLNEQGGNRSKINQAIIEEFTKSAIPAKSHPLIARLPLGTVWTTNYDQLIERSFVSAGKIVDLKLTNENLSQTKPGRDVVIYKMHGCVSQPHIATITKDDYENYDRLKPLFVRSLQGDLISKTFLFLGFSFTDPNIDYILSRVRVSLGANVRRHFCIMRSPQRPTKSVGKAKADYEYEKRKAELRQADLLRFGIQTVWVDQYGDVPLLLEALSSFIHRKSVFVSGAAADPAPFGLDRLNRLARNIGGQLIKDGYNLVSGFGLGIGDQCVVGALQALYGIPKGRDLERLVVRPFPAPGHGLTREQQNTRHREELIARSGVIVVIAGNRLLAAGGTEISPGVQEEVELARKAGKFIVPIGVTGHAAEEIWKKAKVDANSFLPGINVKAELVVLGDASAANDRLIKALFSILAKADKAATV